jgi:endonuclease/exonuclease/phosphatase (EEP) superfamily protein YafD
VRARLPRLLIVVLALLALVSAMALAAALGWPFELFSHFRLQYAVVALLLALAFASLRRPGWASAAMLLAAWHGAPMAQRAVAGAQPVACDGTSFDVVTANLYYASRDPQRFTTWLDRHPADLVVVQEVTPARARSLEALPGYPYHSLVSRSDAYGIGVLSRWPLDNMKSLDLAGDGHPSLAGDAVVDGQRVHFLAVHARWPVLPSLARARDRALHRMAVRVRAQSGPTVVMGDLNLSPDSPAFGRLLNDGRLRDALAGPPWQPTWMAGFWPLALRIDHVLVSEGVCVEESAVGESIHSDHRPVTARLRLPGVVRSAVPPEGA